MEIKGRAALFFCQEMFARDQAMFSEEAFLPESI